MNESDRIILVRGLEKTTPDKLRWQLSQSGFIITDIQKGSGNEEYLIQFPSKEIKQDTAENLILFFINQGRSVDLFNICILDGSFNSKTNSLKWKLGDRLVYRSSFDQLYPLHRIKYPLQIKNKKTQLMRFFFNLHDKIRSQYISLHQDLPEWLSDPRVLPMTLLPFVQSSRMIDYRDYIDMNIFNCNDNGIRNVVVGVVNQYDHSITPYGEDLCKDSFQNKVISQLMPTICSMIQTDSNKKLRLQLNIESPTSLTWRIVNSLSVCDYEKAGVATMTNDTITIEEKRVSQFHVTYFNQTYSLLFNSFHYLNHDITETLQRTLSSWLKDIVINEHPYCLLDLYCGCGFYSLQNAHLFHSVYGVDKKSTNIQSANNNKNTLNIRNTTFVQSGCGSFCETVLPTLTDASTVILDPPTEGCHKRVMQMIRNHPTISNVIYVSSNPRSFRDDAKWLCFPNQEDTVPFRPLMARGFDMTPGLPGYVFATLLSRKSLNTVIKRSFYTSSRLFSRLKFPL